MGTHHTPARLNDVLSALSTTLTAEDLVALTPAWHGGTIDTLTPIVGENPAHAALELSSLLAGHCHTPAGALSMASLLRGRFGPLVGAWLESAAANSTIRVAPMLAAAAGIKGKKGDFTAAAQARVMRGPLHDALACAPFAGAGWLEAESPSRARFLLRVWHVAACAQSVPELGEWWLSDEVNATWQRWARGTLWERAVAARLAAVAADGVPREHPLSPQTLAALANLAQHPEPVVWFSGLRALGRLAGRCESARRLVRGWETSSTASDRRRAVAAVMSMPATHAGDVEQAFAHVLEARKEDQWMLVSVGVALPHLAREHRDVVARLRQSLGRRRPSAELCGSLGSGLRSLWLAGDLDPDMQAWQQQLAEHAATAPRSSAPVAASWSQAELALCLGQGEAAAHPTMTLERVMRSGAEDDPTRASQAATRWLKHLCDTLPERLEQVETGDVAAGTALEWVEGCALVTALGPWVHLAEAAGQGAAHPYPKLRAQLWPSLRTFARKAAAAPDSTLFVHGGLRILGLELDATEHEVRGLGVGSLVQWMRTTPWMTSPTERDAQRHGKRVADLVWRAFECSLDMHDAVDPSAFGRFAAWWALAGGPREPLFWLDQREALARGAHQAFARATHDVLVALLAGPDVGLPLSFVVQGVLTGVRAENTALAAALGQLGSALETASTASTLLEADLAMTTARLLHAAAKLEDVRDDVRLALRTKPVAVDRVTGALSRPGGARASEGNGNTGVASQVGPLLGERVSSALNGVLAETKLRRAPVKGNKLGHVVSGYRLEECLAEGGMGEVWLVRRAKGDRRFVMKRPLTSIDATTVTGEAVRRALRVEAQSLTSFSHPNVANVIEFDPDAQPPFVVFQYLVGCSLHHYIEGRPLTIEEAKPIIRDACQGLRAIHRAGMIHCDIKPENIYLQLDTGRIQERFTYVPETDRDKYPVLSSVIIDFGTASAPWLTESVVAGTAHYASPEQWNSGKGVPPLTSSCDMYAFASTVMEMLTGEPFFPDVPPEAVGTATMTVDPIEQHPLTKSLPRPVQQLLRDASHLDPAQRIDADTFAQRFNALR